MGTTLALVYAVAAVSGPPATDASALGIRVAGAALTLAAAGAAGAAVAWWLHRRTALSAFNLYLAWPVCVAIAVGCATTDSPVVALLGFAVLVAGTVAAVSARRWRLSALGAGGELRQFERSRTMVWHAVARRELGERVYIAGQGELIRERRWPDRVPALPMTGDGRAPVPLGEGMHLMFVGSTGSGKTTSARRWLLARGLGREQTALLVLDPKGDQGLEEDLRGIAADRGRPFVLFDPFDRATDRWKSDLGRRSGRCRGAARRAG